MTFKPRRRGRRKSAIGQTIRSKRALETQSMKLVKSSYHDSQQAFTLLAETTRKQQYFSQQALTVLSCSYIMEVLGCHTKVIHHCFKNISKNPKTNDLQAFTKIISLLIRYNPESLFYYLITFPESIERLVSLISDVSVLKLLLSLWNCSSNHYIQLLTLDKIGRETLVQFINCEYSLASEQIGHMLVFLEILIRRLYSEKIQAARGTLKKHRWNPIVFDFNKDRLRHLKSDVIDLPNIEINENIPFVSPRDNDVTNRGYSSDDEKISGTNSKKKVTTLNLKQFSLATNSQRIDEIISLTRRTPRGGSDDCGDLDPEKDSTDDFFSFLNERETASSLVSKSLIALNVQTRIKTIQLLSTLVRHSQKRVNNINDIPVFIQLIVNNSSKYLKQLRSLPTHPVGFYRLSIVKLFRWIISIRNSEFALNLVKQPIMIEIVNYIFKYPDHSFLINEMQGLFSSLCHSPIVVVSSILDANFLKKLDDLLEKSKQTGTTYPCVSESICKLIYSQQKKFPPRDWKQFAEDWKFDTETRVNAHFTRTKQLTDHWDDFHFLFSSF